MSSSTQKYRLEHDSLGELRVPVEALYGAQTQRGVENFPISGLRLPRQMIRALGLIKSCAAEVNQDLGLLPAERAAAIIAAAESVIQGNQDAHFPVDVFQTGSGTSSNMNCNEVIANLARNAGHTLHPNDHVNLGQSSNDVIPSAIQLSACLACDEQLMPALQHLGAVIAQRSQALREVVKTGRTHLMDAMPITLGQELAAWQAQLAQAEARLGDSLARMAQLPQGGTAVGTGVNTASDFGPRMAQALSRKTGYPFVASENYFVGISSQDAAVELSGQLKTLACSLMKIANDLRWMNSGPLAGLGEIELPTLQPGSSIMPGKVNPVIPEAVAMVCAQIIGNDTTITIAGQSGNFQLNVMLPVVAYNLLQSIELAANACRVLADKAIAGFRVKQQRLNATLAQNPILITALNPVIGYEQGAALAKQAYRQQRPILDVALECTDMSEAELRRLLDPLALTRGGNVT